MMASWGEFAKAEPAMAKLGLRLLKKLPGESTPWWPEGPLPAGAPNVVVVVLDDTGFSHFGCYGSTIETPNVDRLAAEGLRYTSFHTTALCSPTRACLLTGRNHHAVGMRAVSNMDTGFPNMRGALPRSTATLAEILREQGYATFATGKWHLAPMAECTAAGPFHSWPLQRGFDHYYGFLQGETDQFHPELTCDNHFVDPPGTADDGYHVSEDIVDRAIGYIPRPDLAGTGATVLRVRGVRRHALAAPGAEAVPREVPWPLRPGLGRRAGRMVRAPALARRGTARHRARAAQSGRARVGRAPQTWPCRSSRPGVAFVHSPSTNVGSPFTRIQR